MTLGRNGLNPRTLSRARRAAGFTIIEILIAIVVLVLGITGIIALFPTAIESGNQTVEDSYSAAITQSVVDAISVGIREARYTYITPGKEEWTYFIFNHDGVVDPIPTMPEQYTAAQVPASPSFASYVVPTGKSWSSGGPFLYDRDYCILLPKAVDLVSGVGQGNLLAGPNKDVTKEPFFLYPVPLLPNVSPTDESDQRHPTRLDDGVGIVDNLSVLRQRPQIDGTPTAWIPRVFYLGRYRDPFGTPFSVPSPFNPGDVRSEFRGQAANGEETIATDPYPNYSFCFAMRRARIDSNENGRIDETGALTDQDDFSDSLYLLRIMVFKNFSQVAADQLQPGQNPGMAVPKSNVPIRKFVTLISL